MKSLKYALFLSMLLLFGVSCEDVLDPIKEVTPGPDTENPAIDITYPVEGKIVRSSDTVATIVFELLATDDREIGEVVVELDGQNIGTINAFKDYRRAVLKVDYNALVDGDHTLKATVYDKTNKSDMAQVKFKKVTAPAYEPMADEVIYFSFDNSYLNLINGTEAAKVGSPSFAAGKLGDAYKGAADSYLTYPAADVKKSEFSIAFWYKLNPDPKRGGLVSISPPGESRNSGFRFLREDGGTQMKFGINYGIGEEEVWMNPFMTIDPTDAWMHFAITISATKAVIYVDGQVIMENAEVKGPITWADCSSITIASGQPNFVYWEHFSDQSLFDEMHMFTRAITQEEVLKLYNVK